MDDKQLKWTVNDERLLLHTPVFDVTEQREVSATGISGDYIAMSAPDWAMVVAVYNGCFVMVRQWRHAAREMSMEFPGGVVDAGESPARAAARELFEETGFRAEKLTHLGTVSPNPALFSNRFHVFLAEELRPTGEQSLDDDELLTYSLVPIDEAFCAYGKGEYTHALMGTAFALFLQHERLKNADGCRSNPRGKSGGEDHENAR